MNNNFLFILLTILLALTVISILTKYIVNFKKSESSKKNKKFNSNNIYRKNNQNKNFMKDNKTNQESLNGLASATELILQNELDEEIVFKRADKTSTKKYAEIRLNKGSAISSNIVQGALPILERNSTLAELNKLGDLFVSTADTSTLSKFADGTFTTMVRDIKNNLVGHAGYKKIELPSNSITPLTAVNIGMQGMGAVSGQYYLSQIDSELEEINTKLEDIIEYHHDEKIGILINSKNRLSEISKREHVDEADIIEIRALRNKIGEIYQEYKTRLNREHEKVVNAKPKKVLVNKRVAEYKENIDELYFTIQICYTTDRLLNQATLTEIAVRLKKDFKDPIIGELTGKLKENSKESFSIMFEDKIKDIFMPINENAKNIVKNGKDFYIFDKNQEKLLDSISKKEELITKEIHKNSDQILIDKVLNERNKTYEIVISPSDDMKEYRVFVPVEQLN